VVCHLRLKWETSALDYGNLLPTLLSASIGSLKQAVVYLTALLLRDCLLETVYKSILEVRAL